MDRTGGPLNIADMKITFGTDGGVIQIAEVNADKLVDLSTAKNIIKSDISGKAITVDNEIMATLKRIRQ
jgi:hypothetical protein